MQSLVIIEGLCEVVSRLTDIVNRQAEIIEHYEGVSEELALDLRCMREEADEMFRQSIGEEKF